MSETLLNLEAVKRKVSLGHTSIYKLMGLGDFPQPVRISDDSPAVRWLESEIDAWIQSRAAKRSMGANMCGNRPDLKIATESAA